MVICLICNMVKDKYLKQIQSVIEQFSKGKKVQVFLFGSSVRKERFGDCDIGVTGTVSAQELRKLKETFAESTLPYKVDVVNFNNVSDTFKKEVLQNPIVWLKR